MSAHVTENAPPIVLLHGCSGSVHSTFQSTGWLAAIEARGRTAIAPDLPGHGRGPVSHDPAAYGDLAGLLAPSLPAGPFDLVGFSLGGKLALELALRHPNRVRRMVLGGIGDNVFAPEGIAPIAAAALENPSSPATEHPAVRVMLAHWEPRFNDALGVAAVLRRSPNPVFTPGRLRTLAVPLLIVNGSEDPVALHSDALLSSLAHASRTTLQRVDHFGLPRQTEFQRIALAFLDGESLP